MADEKQSWCSKAGAGCQPAPLGSSPRALSLVRATVPARTAWKNFGAQRPVRPAPLGRRHGGRRPVRAASPHHFESALMSWHSLSDLGAQRPVRASSPHPLQAAVVLTSRCRLLAGSSLGAQGLVRASSSPRLEAALVLKACCAP